MSTTLSYHDKNNLKSKLNDFDSAHATSPMAQLTSSSTVFFLPGRTRKTCPMFGVKRSFSLIGLLVPWARPGFEAEASDR